MNVLSLAHSNVTPKLDFPIFDILIYPFYAQNFNELNKNQFIAISVGLHQNLVLINQDSKEINYIILPSEFTQINMEEYNNFYNLHENTNLVSVTENEFEHKNFKLLIPNTSKSFLKTFLINYTIIEPLNLNYLNTIKEHDQYSFLKSNINCICQYYKLDDIVNWESTYQQYFYHERCCVLCGSICPKCYLTQNHINILESDREKLLNEHQKCSICYDDKTIKYCNTTFINSITIDGIYYRCPMCELKCKNHYYTLIDEINNIYQCKNCKAICYNHESSEDCKCCGYKYYQFILELTQSHETNMYGICSSCKLNICPGHNYVDNKCLICGTINQ